MRRSGRSCTVSPLGKLVLGPWKAEIVAKCRAFVVVAKQSTATQFRQYQIHKVFEPTRKSRRQDHKAIGPLVLEDFLQLICDFLRTADDQHMSATNGNLIKDISHGHVA